MKRWAFAAKKLKLKVSKQVGKAYTSEEKMHLVEAANPRSVPRESCWQPCSASTPACETRNSALYNGMALIC